MRGNFFGWIAFEKTFNRFVVVGIFNTIVSYSVFLLLLFIGFNHWLANFFALILGIGVGFKGGGIFVFRNANPSLWLRFVSLWCCVYVVIGFFIGALRSYGLSYYVSGLVALPISALFSYFGQKYFVFGRGEGG